MYLLDTNVCVQYLRGRNLWVRQRLASKAVLEIAVSSDALAELYLGALRSARPTANRAKIDAFVQPFACLPFDSAAAEIHDGIRHHLGYSHRTARPANRGNCFGPRRHVGNAQYC